MQKIENIYIKNIKNEAHKDIGYLYSLYVLSLD